jgi:hypothetical protein
MFPPHRITSNLTPTIIMSKPLIEAPASSASTTIETLGYIEAYDAVNNDDYAFVAYKETDSSGEWRVQIKGKQTPGAVFEPEAMRLQSRAAGAQGKPWFPWGWSFDASESDARHIEFRVHIIGGKPSEIEMFVQVRKFDGTAEAPVSAKFPWPA